MDDSTQDVHMSHGRLGLYAPSWCLDLKQEELGSVNTGLLCCRAVLQLRTRVRLPRRKIQSQRQLHYCNKITLWFCGPNLSKVC